MKFSGVLIALGLVLSNFYLGGFGRKVKKRSQAQAYKFLTNPTTYRKIREDVKEGTKAALDTCKTLFKNQRWNCEVGENIKRAPGFWGNILPANREGALLHGMTSASVMYTLTRNCRQGRYADCACVPVNKPAKPGQSWRWAGCKENLKFGEDMAKLFIDKLERRNPTDQGRSALNLHNNEVGRKVVRINAIKVCKCHGASGSCHLKTCWRQLLQFTKVGEMMKEKYDQAVRVSYVNNTIQPRDPGVSLTNRSHRHLVYFDTSPDYCQPDSLTGFPGMRGRKCIHGNDGAQKCNRMCTSCGLKFRNEVMVKSEKCKCKFVWCCKIECHNCDKDVTVTTCL